MRYYYDDELDRWVVIAANVIVAMFMTEYSAKKLVENSKGHYDETHYTDDVKHIYSPNIHVNHDERMSEFVDWS